MRNHPNGRYGSLSGATIDDPFGLDLRDAANAGKSAGQLTGAKAPASSGSSIFSGLTSVLDKIAGGAEKGLDIYGKVKAGSTKSDPAYYPTSAPGISTTTILLVGAGIGAYFLMKRRK